jgi:hypothetical protein
VLAVSGIGVLVVISFVAALAFSDVDDDPPVDRLTAVASSAPAGLTVIVGRCREQRVVDLEVSSTDGKTLWRVTSEKGSIERRYEVGSDPPVEFLTVVPYDGQAEPRLEARATIRRPGHATEIHRASFDVARLDTGEPNLGDSAPPCPDSADLGLVVILFVVGAAVVVGGYAAMVMRALRIRR